MVKVSGRNTNEPMLDMFIFETSQLIEQLEQSILSSEKSSCYTPTAINEIFRIMHTIKGSSAMMIFNNISTLAHHIEDLFYFLREEKPNNIDCSTLSDLVLEGVDFIKIEMEKIKNGDEADGEVSQLIERIKGYLSILKRTNISTGPVKDPEKVDTKGQRYYISQDKAKTSIYANAFKAVIYFEEGCEMENIRAYTIIHNLKDITEQIFYMPEDIIDNDDSVEIIRREGFKVYIKTDYSYEEMHKFFMQAIFLKDLELIQLENVDELKQFSTVKEAVVQKNPIKVPSLHEPDKRKKEASDKEINSTSMHQSIISVSVPKLDKLMDLVGEMVIAEAMVIQNPDLKGLELDNFQKAARQLNKITSDIQDMVMSIRMVPLSTTFHKMHRIVRDMCKKLDKEVQLEIIGEETEVDKNIIEHISDPLMHLVRNAIDHGIESTEDREMRGKSPSGRITLEAKNAGSDVLIILKDDGKGLSREKILMKAREQGLLYRSEDDMSDKEVLNLILIPGFSTKDGISEFSGRGVGMDVVTRNIEAVGGSVSVDSILNNGTTITLKIPLTLAIIDGMNIRVGNSCYTLPTISIKESFRPKEGDIITDPDGNEMIMVRGQCYSILRLHEVYKIKNSSTSIFNGIIIMVEHDDKTLCIFADELLGQQQVVVKALPKYIQNFKKIKGLAGCTLLGDGSISLILDITGLINN
ncbi:two-component system, chemotaxis family, sensor kinase CheA [Anaerovirgula multivorans]|uniref:Chemotaxis protein CheA n=1 Tax=Anaerovirgula multivorans TaxID=312168 RepID=A0A239BBZ8_9FIRM|nr:chemotaxis protein CheA [Anaerovirgula multivorans]SNS05081.1 two-component system, chemotaxis family, sensor kinase CheA [Anaerovirgula multivorans]